MAGSLPDHLESQRRHVLSRGEVNANVSLKLILGANSICSALVPKHWQQEEKGCRKTYTAD